MSILLSSFKRTKLYHTIVQFDVDIRLSKQFDHNKMTLVFSMVNNKAAVAGKVLTSVGPRPL